uniref:Interferon-induced protein 44-like isoform X1 n=1 Tax=Crassostrea virginica TaxID=6565 RepID=A0A8B8BDK3_CRAVI|nr:interferon-induced protein 44-like isoform X1 [Crassostrea virginica]
MLHLKVFTNNGQQSAVEKPWRDQKWNEEYMSVMRQSLETYKPNRRPNVGTANILLLGQIGAGKSSFFNTVNSIFRGKITSQACIGSFGHSVTLKYRQYRIIYRRFSLCDTRGFEEDAAVDAQELLFILDGNVPDRYQFNPMVPFTYHTPGYIKNPALENKIHCVAFVIDGSTVDEMSDKILKQLKDLQITVNQRGLPQIVLLTKVDKICPDVNADVTKTFTSSAVCSAVEKVANIMGLPRARVFPVKNYENETGLVVGINILVLEAMKRCLDLADDFIEEQV